MRLLQILLLVFLPVAVAQADCGRLSKDDTYERLNQIIECLESKISELRKNLEISSVSTGNDLVPSETSIAGEEVEDNNIVPEANLIKVGQRVRGKIPKPEDRDFYKFRTSGQAEKFRVILRKLSVTGFKAYVHVYNEFEEQLDRGYGNYDTPVSMLVESKPDSFYYVSVTSVSDHPGEYELVVREEQ